MKNAKRSALQEEQLRYVQESQVYAKIKKRRRRGLYRRLAVYSVLAIVLAGSFISVFISQNKLLNEKTEEKEQLQQELVQVETLEKDLQAEIKRLNDYEYIGEIARRDFFFSKKGETIFRLPTDSSTN